MFTRVLSSRSSGGSSSDGGGPHSARKTPREHPGSDGPSPNERARKHARNIEGLTLGRADDAEARPEKEHAPLDDAPAPPALAPPPTARRLRKVPVPPINLRTT